jgi:hypothetical protein
VKREGNTSTHLNIILPWFLIPTVELDLVPLQKKDQA